MNARTVLAVLPGSRPNQRLQVALAQPEGSGLTIELYEQHYADGIGWFDQRRLSLEPTQFKQLQAVLGMKSAAWTEPSEPRATIPFPGPADSNERRKVAGD
jgi:hypothetical protein